MAITEIIRSRRRFNSQRTIDGYDYLAEQHGLRSGQTLMKMVLDAYLEAHLPEEF